MPTQAAGLPDSTTHARAEQVHGKLVPDPSGPCRPRRSVPSPSALRPGYLLRCRVPVTAETDALRQSGSRRHHEIGRQTDLVRGAGTLQAVLLIAIGLVILLLAALVLRGLG